MPSVQDHYESLLAEVYAWSLGDPAAVEAAAALEFDQLGVQPAGQDSLAVDLGCGHGVHLKLLGARGFRVIGIDSSPVLAAAARSALGGFRGEVIDGDLLAMPGVGIGRAEWIFCLGDTLTHLDSPESVATLVDRVAARLAPGGRLVLTFRDYTRPPLEGSARFIPVRVSDERLMTCFLEDGGDHVVVHDLVHDREGGRWKLRVGAYRKIKVSPSHVETLCREGGLSARLERGPRGMVRVVARRPV